LTIKLLKFYSLRTIGILEEYCTLEDDQGANLVQKGIKFEGVGKNTAVAKA